MSVCAVHRDRRAMLAKIEPEFEKIRAGGTRLLTINTDALDAEKRREVIDELARRDGQRARARAAALGGVREPEAARRRGEVARQSAAAELAGKLGVDADKLQNAIDEVFAAGRAQALGPRERARVLGQALPRRGGLLPHDPRDGHEPARLGAGAVRARPVRRRRARVRPHQRGQRGGVEGLCRGRGREGLARIARALDRGRVRALRHPLQRDPGRHHPHARAGRDPGLRAHARAGAVAQPDGPTHHARGRRERDRPARERRGGLDQRRGDPRRRRRAHLGRVARERGRSRAKPASPSRS